MNRNTIIYKFTPKVLTKPDDTKCKAIAFRSKYFKKIWGKKYIYILGKGIKILVFKILPISINGVSNVF